MNKYAIVNSLGLIENIIVSEEKEAVDFLFGANKIVVMETEATGIAFIGATYRQDKEKFMPYRPFDTWIFNEESWSWEAPIAKPEVADGKIAVWDGLQNNWVEISMEFVA
jgi:hypothetical protein